MKRSFQESSWTTTNDIITIDFLEQGWRSECAFGIASSKFRILLKAIETKVENADHIVKAICILHNVIIDKKKEISSCQDDLSDYLNKNEREKNNAMLGFHGGRSDNRASRTAIVVRNTFVEYFKVNKLA